MISVKQNGKRYGVVGFTARLMMRLAAARVIPS